MQDLKVLRAEEQAAAPSSLIEENVSLGNKISQLEENAKMLSDLVAKEKEEKRKLLESHGEEKKQLMVGEAMELFQIYC